MDLSIYKQNQPKAVDDLGVQLLKKVTLGNGVTLSIQASSYHYCLPRITDPTYKCYTHFEVGFPSEPIPELMEYAEDPSMPTNTVYGYVPKEVLMTIFNKYGITIEA